MIKLIFEREHFNVKKILNNLVLVLSVFARGVRLVYLGAETKRTVFHTDVASRDQMKKNQGRDCVLGKDVKRSNYMKKFM